MYKKNGLIFTYYNNHGINFISVHDSQKGRYNVVEGWNEWILENYENTLKDIIGNSINYENIIAYLENNCNFFVAETTILELVIYYHCDILWW